MCRQGQDRRLNPIRRFVSCLAVCEPVDGELVGSRFHIRSPCFRIPGLFLRRMGRNIPDILTADSCSSLTLHPKALPRCLSGNRLLLDRSRLRGVLGPFCLGVATTAPGRAWPIAEAPAHFFTQCFALLRRQRLPPLHHQVATPGWAEGSAASAGKAAEQNSG